MVDVHTFLSNDRPGWLNQERDERSTGVGTVISESATNNIWWSEHPFSLLQTRRIRHTLISIEVARLCNQCDIMELLER